MTRIPLDYKESIGWFGSDETVAIRMPDAVFQRHLLRWLQTQGLPTMTYSEALDQRKSPDELTAIAQARKQGVDSLCQNLDYWKQCGDPEVRIYRSEGHR